MKKRSKRFREIEKLFVPDQVYSLDKAIDILKQCPSLKFDQSVEIALKTGLDVKKSDQQVRSTIALPKGTGKEIRILVFARGDKVKEANEAGAEYAGDAELLEKVKGGWIDFDAIVATPDMMRDVGRLGKVLGPRGLMPTPKAGTVTNEVGKAVKELKAGKIEFKNDKSGNINSIAGKLSFSKEDLIENIESFLRAVAKAKPAAAKGNYMQSLVISSTMGPGIKIELDSIAGI